MAVHPGVPIRSLRAFGTPMAFRHRGTMRRKTPSPSSRDAAGGGSTACGEERASAPANSMASWASTGSLSQQPQSLDACGMQVEGETGTGGRGREGVEAAATAAAAAETTVGYGAFRPTRRMSDPGDKREIMSDPGLGFGVDVSSSQGITMDVVHGTVRSKTPLAIAVLRDSAADGGADSPNGMPSMVDLAVAVDEAAAAEATVSPFASPAASPAASPVPSPAESPTAREPVERTYRATSSVAAFTGLMAGGSQGPSKRAKSGATLFNLDGSGSPPMSVSVGRMGWSKVASGPGVASRDGGLGATSGAAGAAVILASEKIEDEGKVGTGGGDGAPATNEAWLALLSPLLPAVPVDTHPEDFLHEILRERGYSTEMVAVKDTVFHRAPEPEQVAGYDKAILSAVLDEDEVVLERMRASGRRMDACNKFGDSVLHMACRRGRVGALRYFLRVCGPGGVVLSDDFGRTVMHDACWTASPRFDVASSVLDVDTRLLRMVDSRGSSPLQYVPQDQWALWCAFFESRKEIYWPKLAPGEQDVAGVIQRSGGGGGGGREGAAAAAAKAAERRVSGGPA